MKILPEVAEKFPRLAEQLIICTRRDENTRYWEDSVYSHLTVVEAAPDKVVWQFVVDESHCNQIGSWHGGCVATIIDICSSFALMVHEGKTQWKYLGVSTDLSVSYLRGVPSGTKARIECDVHRVGKSLANLFVKIYDEEGNLCYTGTHSKYCLDPKL
ncbi:hypothetical protein EC973_008201 [Apophysomyces ossiformis]|uniref:Thioesterase domain-containing protein n=1 Tax=Apophysomyces ossiformis TaxID=679940 RepID=A0A8H7BTZ0_9FUNG|nr:hypothetical protein EC973_008201 [Apophysomyces ossiformis]